ncbi:retron St85 family RNA-directed DNA polymerase [Thalassomonas haliotis]|uniref:RNA-directed DNA polymerase n=1 Tax=Thalassomonas haliotis TaxID=485448 RepID=A0ABY7VGG8_9GAMM|nr:retron St85 family RNA-directed DNA polymerase [Thalassomonas haliotis]WDE12570.1 RNA-directed DNA polymerase [Thalassomonas haliotis]
MNIEALLMDELIISKSELYRFAKTAPHRYKKYKIAKRNGVGTRDIAQPSKQVKYFQRLIVHELEARLPVHLVATAYKKGVGIKENALMHLDHKYMLKMDFENFFPSIQPSFLFGVCDVLNLDLSPNDKELISNFLFYKLRKNSPLRLSIGAPSSPFISNVVMFLFDSSIVEYCKGRNITYTRYADDLTFSTNVKDSLYEIPNIIKKELIINTYKNIRINKNKTVFTSKAKNRHVTGVTLTNDDLLSIGRKRKRLISSMVHKFKQGRLDKERIYELKGLLSFANHIEPIFIFRLRGKYGDCAIDSLI